MFVTRRDPRHVAARMSYFTMIRAIERASVARYDLRY